MTTADAAAASTAAPPDLGVHAAEAMPRRIGTFGSLALAISNVGPTISVGIGLGVLAGTVGAQMPIVFILAFLPMFGIAIAYRYLNQVEPNCGTAYVWLRKSFSPWVGYLAGWVGISGALIFLSYGAPLTGQITLANLQGFGLPVDPASPWQTTLTGVLWLTLVTVIAVRGTDVAVRAQIVLVVIEVVIVGVIAIAAMVGGDASPVRASWFDPTQVPSVTALATGLVLAAYVYWGWDSAFSVTEETESPRQASRAGLLTLVAVLVMFVVSAVAFQRALSPAELAEHGTLGLPYLGNVVLGSAGETAAGLAMLFSAIAVLQSVVIVAARVTLAMGRDGTLGPVWTRLHPRFGTPAMGTMMLAGLALVLTLLSALVGPLQTMILGVVTGVGILISLSYGTAGLACAWRFRDSLHNDPKRAVLAVVLPTVSSLALFGLGGVLVVSQARSTDHFALDPTNGWFLIALPAAVLTLGLVMAAWTRYVRKAPYFLEAR